MTSVIVPAHDEAAGIGACLAAVLRDARTDEFEVIVVCNGCSDDTAAIARRFEPAVLVLETPVASKVAALNLGESHATRFPRVYVDGDVELDTDDLREVVRALADDPDLLAASPTPRYDTSRSSRIVASYLRVWTQLPTVRSGTTGAGVYAVSQTGRTRFDHFPDVTGDDRFFEQLFDAGERRRLPTATSRVRAPGDLRGLLARRTRVIAGNAEQPPAGGVPGRRWRALAGVVRQEPRRIVDVPAFLAVTLLAEWIAGRQRRGGSGPSWSRDHSSRDSSTSRTRVPGRTDATT